MVSLNTMRTKFGIILSVIIAGALLAFIFSLKNDMGFSGNDPKVGEINGDKILYSEYVAAYDDVKSQAGGEAADEAQSEQMASAAWQTLFADHVLLPGFEQAGISVSDSERKAIIMGEHASQAMSNAFGNPATGQYDTAAVMQFLSQSESNPQAQKAWEMLTRQAVMERNVAKYFALLRNGAYANALEVAQGVKAANETYAGEFVACQYSTVADSLVSVSSSDLKKYYESHKAAYKQQPYRALSYVVFEVNPTDADKQAIEADARKAGEEFAAATDVKAYIRDNRHGAIAQNYVPATALSADEAAALSAGKQYGPALTGEEWKASRVVDVKIVPDTLELQHIVLSYTDDKLADSLYSVAGKSDFAALAAQYSVAETAQNGGDLGKVPFSALNTDFAEALAGAKVGSVVKFAFGNSIQLIKVTGATAPVRHMLIASLSYPVEASQATTRDIHNAASLFAANAKRDAKNFKQVADEQSASVRETNIIEGQRQVRGLDDSREIVRWAEGAEKNAISDVTKAGKDYVVAQLSAIVEDEYKPLSEVESQIRPAVLRDKKFDIVAAKMTGSTLAEVAQNAGSKVDSFSDVKYSAYYIPTIGFEPTMAGAIASAQKDAVSKVIKGQSAAFVFVVNDIQTAETQTAEQEAVRATAQGADMAVQRAMYAIQQMAAVRDLRGKYF